MTIKPVCAKVLARTVGGSAAASFSKGEINKFCWGGGGSIAFIFSTGRSKLNAPPGGQRGKRGNQL